MCQKKQSVTTFLILGSLLKWRFLNRILSVILNHLDRRRPDPGYKEEPIGAHFLIETLVARYGGERQADGAVRFPRFSEPPAEISSLVRQLVKNYSRGGGSVVLCMEDIIRTARKAGLFVDILGSLEDVNEASKNAIARGVECPCDPKAFDDFAAGWSDKRIQSVWGKFFRRWAVSGQVFEVAEESWQFRYHATSRAAKFELLRVTAIKAISSERPDPTFLDFEKSLLNSIPFNLECGIPLEEVEVCPPLLVSHGEPGEVFYAPEWGGFVHINFPGICFKEEHHATNAGDLERMIPGVYLVYSNSYPCRQKTNFLRHLFGERFARCFLKEHSWGFGPKQWTKGDSRPWVILDDVSISQCNRMVALAGGVLPFFERSFPTWDNLSLPPVRVLSFDGDLPPYSGLLGVKFICLGATPAKGGAI
jgi:hypothetical protein